MRLREDFNQIIVRENPGCLWLFGIFFMSVGGAFVYGALGGFTNHATTPKWQLMLAFIMGASAVGCGIWIIYNAPFTKLFINRQTNRIRHERRGLSGKIVNEYSFDEIEQFALLEEKDDEGDQIWSLSMNLTNGETVKISVLPSHAEQPKQNFAFQINEFMHKQMPSYQRAELPEDETKGKIS